ncbi:hypothetical protein RHSIM_RhsimUnG0066800 [Rhododendron simsii]|uniref:Cysteine-rich transmembrane domain-containing protein n=1 Tax=Rhododendron simsii TaxID=118357 RepID=A0A834FWE6_RHOSS|nr:hypothetical protein RHSIM_RhsimUnG0066800 [Rhododendron simsii]
MNDPKYAYPYPAQGFPSNTLPHPAQGYNYQGPPVMAPPQYAAPPRKETGFLQGCRAALGCCCLLDEYCCDPSVFCVF